MSLVVTAAACEGARLLSLCLSGYVTPERDLLPGKNQTTSYSKCFPPGMLFNGGFHHCEVSGVVWSDVNFITSLRLVSATVFHQVSQNQSPLSSHSWLLPTKLKTSSKVKTQQEIPLRPYKLCYFWLTYKFYLVVISMHLLTAIHSCHGSVPLCGVALIFFPLVEMPTRSAYNTHRAVRLRGHKRSSSVSNKAASWEGQNGPVQSLKHDNALIMHT